MTAGQIVCDLARSTCTMVNLDGAKRVLVKPDATCILLVLCLRLYVCKQRLKDLYKFYNMVSVVM